MTAQLVFHWLIVPLLMTAFLSGRVIGRHREAKYWREHAGPYSRSAVCSDSTFFYVIPEQEYVDLELDHQYLNKLKEECGIT